MTHDRGGSKEATQAVVCTIVSKNYLAHARTLMRSLSAARPRLRLVTLLVDDLDGYFDPSDEPFEMLLASDLGIPNWRHMSMKYEITELNTAVKPYLLELLFDRFRASKVIYFDPDIVVYGPLGELLELLDRHGVVLTPHILAPLDDDRSPSELDFLRVGSYNLGFIGLSRVGDWRDLLHWWQKKVYTDCTREIERGVFVDQHWIDLVPSLFDSVFVLRHPGYNLAYWNFNARSLESAGLRYVVNGKPLVFFHYSGFSYDDIDRVSRHQNRFVLSDLGANYRHCFEDYRRRLRESGFEVVRDWPYAYGTLPGGAPVAEILRICLRTADPVGARWPDPYDARPGQGFVAWAVTPGHPEATRHLSPYALTLHAARRDLQLAFPRPRAEDERAYAEWFVEQAGSSTFFHPLYVEPIRKALGAGSTPTGPARRRLADRLRAAHRYWVSYPVAVAPHIPAAAIEQVPEVYTGPGGIYGGVRESLRKLRLLQLVRKALGLRTILSLRFFFTYPSGAAALDPSSGRSGPDGRTAEPESDPPGVEGAPAGAVASPAGVNVIGFVHAETGVGEVARKVLRSLEAVGSPAAVLPVDAFDTSRHADRAADRFPRGLPHSINVFNVNADMTFPVRELLGGDVYAGRYNVGYWFWEISDFPEAWADAFRAYDEIWVSSGFVHATVAERSPIPVVRLPIAIEPTVPTGIARADLGVPERGFVALYVFDALSVVERKNPWAALRAFERAFSHSERGRHAHLVIKVTNLERFPQEARRLREEAARVGAVLLEGYLERPKVNALIASCDAYLSLHRSEGFGLTIAEAMWLGKPVIATAYSGNLDLMTPDNCYPVPFRIVELERDYPPYARGCVWAEPDCDAAATMLRAVFDSPDEGRRRGSTAAGLVRSTLSYEQVGRRIADRLNLIGARLRA